MPCKNVSVLISGINSSICCICSFVYLFTCSVDENDLLCPAALIQVGFSP